MDRHAALGEFERIADRYPVFRILPLAADWSRGPGRVLELSAPMTVRPGQRDGFAKQAAECVRLTREKDTRTLRYDWFLSSDGTRCEVREAYWDAAGLIEHRADVGPAVKVLFERYADDHRMTV